MERFIIISVCSSFPNLKICTCQGMHLYSRGRRKRLGLVDITPLVFSFIMIGGRYMILKTSKEEVLERLKPAEKAEEAETSFCSAPHRK